MVSAINFYELALEPKAPKTLQEYNYISIEAFAFVITKFHIMYEKV